MRILLAEDEKSLARALVTLLKKHHYEVSSSMVNVVILLVN